MKHKFLFGIFRPEKNRTTFSDVPFFLKFSTGTTKKVMFHSLSDRIFCDLFVNGKQARVLVGKTSFEA